jgi:hypothetical protein
MHSLKPSIGLRLRISNGKEFKNYMELLWLEFPPLANGGRMGCE